MYLQTKIGQRNHFFVLSFLHCFFNVILHIFKQNVVLLTQTKWRKNEAQMRQT